MIRPNWILFAHFMHYANAGNNKISLQLCVCFEMISTSISVNFFRLLIVRSVVSMHTLGAKATTKPQNA